MSELKPCPFCGGEAKLSEIVDLCYRKFAVECKKCGASTNGFLSRTTPSKAWNIRADEKVGKWAENVDGAYICSSCGCYDYEASKYCLICGAEMEAVNDGK